MDNGVIGDLGVLVMEGRRLEEEIVTTHHLAMVVQIVQGIQRRKRIVKVILKHSFKRINRNHRLLKSVLVGLISYSEKLKI